MGRLDQKTILITGGTSGIGEACAKEFAKEGGSVIITGRSEQKGTEVVADIKKIGGNARFVSCDVTDISAVRNLKRTVIDEYGRLDVLMNNAGVLKTAPLEQIKEEDWLSVFDVNMHAVMMVTQTFIDMILESKGNILNNVSIDGLQSLTRGRASYAYSCSKAAAIKFTQQVALNYTPQGIRVNCLCPGVTETPLFTNRDFSRFTPSIPMGRVGQPDEIAKAALFLVSGDASYVSGAVLTVDGAASLM